MVSPTWAGKCAGSPREAQENVSHLRYLGGVPVICYGSQGYRILPHDKAVLLSPVMQTRAH